MRVFLAMLLVLAGLAGPAVARDVDPQGRSANIDGRTFERRIEAALVARGLTPISHSKWVARGKPDGEWLLKNVPFTNVYHTPSRTEFVIHSLRRRHDIRIEAKWQQVHGSVDEKLPYLYLNAVEAMPEPTVVVVIDGPGWRQGALQWLRRMAKERRYTGAAEKTVLVLSLAEFLAWIAEN
jgi:hypothetical protein